LTTSIEQSDLELWKDARPRTLIARIISGLITFGRRKPLGAFGGILLFIPIILSTFGPGLNLGIVTVPRLTQDSEDYTLGEGVLEGPSSSHIMGRDTLGRDYFARIVEGGRLSFIIGWGVFALSSVISTTLTIVSAYFIRSLDLILQRGIEIVGFLPELILLVAIFSIYGATPITLIVTLGLLRGFNSSRILRSLVIQVRAMPYIEAAHMIGATNVRVIARHILPQVGFLIIVTATNGLAQAVLVESGLAIIGFGLDPNYPTLGNLLNGSRQFLRTAPYLALFPGLVIFMLLLGSRLLGDALRDVLDPRQRGSGR